jgi:hypothetical protein
VECGCWLEISGDAAKKLVTQIVGGERHGRLLR